MMRLLKIVSGTLTLLVACNTKQERTNPVAEKITESVYAAGFVKSGNQYQVFAAVNGLIAEVLVAEGDTVKKGGPIIRISNTTAQLNTDNARLSAEYSSVAANTEKLNELRNNITLAKLKMDNDASLLQRQRNLWEQQIGSRNEVEQRELAYQSSQTAWQAARLRYTELEKQLNFQSRQAQKNLQISGSATADYTVRSTKAGRVYSILKEKGEMVSMQSPVAIIGDDNVFTLELQVDEYDIARIRQGQKIVLGMDSYKGQVFEAVVSKINPLMNDRSKSFTVEATFTKQPPVLYPNLTCEANIIILEKEKALTIPRAFLLEGDSVILENKRQRKVVTGLKDYQKVEIVSGLTVNDVILKPAQ